MQSTHFRPSMTSMTSDELELACGGPGYQQALPGQKGSARSWSDASTSQLSWLQLQEAVVAEGGSQSLHPGRDALSQLNASPRVLVTGQLQPVPEFKKEENRSRQSIFSSKQSCLVTLLIVIVFLVIANLISTSMVFSLANGQQVHLNTGGAAAQGPSVPYNPNASNASAVAPVPVTQAPQSGAISGQGVDRPAIQVCNAETKRIISLDHWCIAARPRVRAFANAPELDFVCSG